MTLCTPQELGKIQYQFTLSCARTCSHHTRTHTHARAHARTHTHAHTHAYMLLKDVSLYTDDLQVLAVCVLYYMIPDMCTKVDVARVVTWMKVCCCICELIPCVDV